MTNPILPNFQPQGASLAELDSRAREIFRRIVETYLETGEPVGSRTISRGGVHLSPASIRNTMQDLTELGLLGAPHISAGRLPTHAGLRLFVDGLLEIGDLAEVDRKSIEARLSTAGRSIDEAMNEATAILSGLAGGAGVVVTPVREAGVKHVEFVALSPDQALAIMVFEDGMVENRLMRRSAGTTPSALQEASNFLNSRLRGRSLAEAEREIAAELERGRRELDGAAARLIEEGLAAWSGGEGAQRALIVRGRANLIGEAQAMNDLERVRMLFDDLEQKEQLIDLLDDVRQAQGVRISHWRREPPLLALGFRRHRRALYVWRRQGAGRNRRHRPSPAQLRPGYPAGGLYRPGAWQDHRRVDRCE